MQTLRGEYYLKRDFGFYDSGILAVLNPTALAVYEVLRRFVWRSGSISDEELRRVMREGKLATRVKQQTVAEYLGLSRRKTVTEHLKTLKDLGWVKMEGDPKNGRSMIYVLGEVVRDREGYKHEVFYADAWMKDLVEMLERECRQETKNPDARLSDLPMTRRISLVRQEVARFASRAGDSIPPSDPPSAPEGSHEAPTSPHEVVSGASDEPSPDTVPSGGCPEKRPPPGRKTGQGVSAKPPTISTEEKKEEKTTRKCGASAHTPRRPQPQAFAGVTLEAEEDDEDAAPLPPVPTSPERARLERIVAESVERSEAQQRANRERQLNRNRQMERKKENLQGKNRPPGARKQLSICEEIWRVGLRERFPNVKTAKWGPTEKGKCTQLLEKYDAEIIENALRYLISEWTKIQERFLKGGGTVPSLGLLLKLHDILVVESQRWAELKMIADAWKQWFKDNPGDAYPPPELERKYQEAEKEIKALGLV